MKDNIIDMALNLFRRNGIRNVTMDMVAAEVGISKRTLYEYFQAKDSLVEACLTKELDRRRQMASEIISSSNHIVETYILFTWNYILELRRTHYLFMQDIRRLYPGTLCKQAYDFESHLKNKVASFVRQGQQEGVFRKDINPELSAIILFQQYAFLLKKEKLFFLRRNIPLMKYLLILPYILSAVWQRPKDLA